MEMIKINEGNCGESLYRVFLGTGTFYLQEFLVYAYNEQEAVDLIADYVEAKELKGLYSDHYHLADLCEGKQTVDEYDEEHALTCCGNHGIYIHIAGMEEIK